jgi:hypothetical protein
VRNSARSARWQRSTFPVVVGDLGWVSRCSMPFSRHTRSNNTSTGGWLNWPSWPLLKRGGVDMFQPFPLGTDPRGRTVPLELMYTNVLIGSIPG